MMGHAHNPNISSWSRMILSLRLAWVILLRGGVMKKEGERGEIVPWIGQIPS